MSNQFFEHPVLNSPYEYPRRHWELDTDGQPTQKIVETRRRAEFITPIPKPKKRKDTPKQSDLGFGDAKNLSTASQRYDSAFINDLRRKVDTWREIPNPADWGVTPETARLLEHWRHYPFAGKRPFFCQIEAVETIIWLTEAAPNAGKTGTDFLAHFESASHAANPELNRLALKLATGTGKTTVMAMVIAWQTINAVRQYPERIEITNPGGPPPGIRIENILWEQMPRNRRLAEAFARCGLVERSGQGMNRIYESCIRESKSEPDFTHTDADHFWITLHGEIRHPEFLRLLEKIGRERLLSFSLDDFIVIQALYEGKHLQPRFHESARRLLEEGLIERNTRAGPNPFILSRRLYASIGKKGVHTRKKGLDRDTNKALLLGHIEVNSKEGSRMDEFKQILPFLKRSSIQVLLREMREEGLIHSHGNTRAGKWYPGPERPDCNHE